MLNKMKINDFLDFVIFQAALNSQRNFMKRANLFLQSEWQNGMLVIFQFLI